MSRDTPAPHLSAIAEAVRAPGQPEASFAAIEKACAATIGHILFTVLLRHEVTGEAERFWTSHPKEYPVGGRKPLNPTFWTEHVLRQQRPYLGNDYEAVKAVFFDHELIRSLGCESVLNVPVVWNGRSLGTINLLHEAGWYREADIPLAQTIAALAVPAYLMLVNR
ncbi:GAF domain-containing protein [Elioraea rosea]|uniref:GAF domain-containing protein n=1 Tax=Elioraea rosea TaxID=2492390 RepID=UPI0011821444|nr:GAF domain-containing protein [Elioraea rosea]